MRSDGFDEESQRDYWRPKNEISGVLDDDFLKAKSWNKKLYNYEANMPDRFVTKFLSTFNDIWAENVYIYMCVCVCVCVWSN